MCINEKKKHSCLQMSIQAVSIFSVYLNNPQWFRVHINIYVIFIILSYLLNLKYLLTGRQSTKIKGSKS